MARSFSMTQPGYRALLTQAASINGVDATFGAGAGNTSVAETFDIVTLTLEGLDAVAHGTPIHTAWKDLHRQHHQMTIAGRYGAAESTGANDTLRVRLLSKNPTRAKRIDEAWKSVDHQFPSHYVQLLILPMYDAEAFVGYDGKHEFVWPIAGPVGFPENQPMEAQAFAQTLQKLPLSLGMRSGDTRPRAR